MCPRLGKFILTQDGGADTDLCSPHSLFAHNQITL